jgi:DNA polymerase-3 subunit delta'
MALRLEHPDLHWHFPLTRPKGATGDKLGDALETARARALDELRGQPVNAIVGSEPQGIYLAAVRNLRRKALQRPAMSPRQVFVIGRAEELVPQESSPEAANALLKLLEEPPPDTFFILTSGEPGRLLPTIRSRTLPFHVPGLSAAQVVDFLSRHSEASQEAVERAARLSHGAIGVALGYLPAGESPGPLESVRRDAYRLLQAALNPSPGAAFKPALGFPVSGARGLGPVFSALEAWIRDLGAAASGAPEAIVNVDARDHLLRSVEKGDIQPGQAAQAMEALDQARILAAGNVNPQLIMAGLLRDLQGLLSSVPDAH